MYCKYCGKEIADDSSFCRYCGGKVLEESEKHMSKSESNNTIHKYMNVNPQTTKSPVRKNNSSITKELIANLKMIGIAAFYVVFYMLCFTFVHKKDISTYDFETHSSYLGESCYDPEVIKGNYILHWEQRYYELLYFALYNKSPILFSYPSPEECLKETKSLEKEYERIIKTLDNQIKSQHISKRYITESELRKRLLEDTYKPQKLKAEAKADVARNIEDWNSTINDYRKSGFKKHFLKTALNIFLISIVVTVLGRYLIKLIYD